MQRYIKGGLCNGTKEKEEEEALEETWITVAKYEGTPILFLIWLTRDVSFTFSRSQRKPKFLQMLVKGKERRLKEHSLKGLQSLGNCYAHAPVHSPMSRFLHTQGCFARHLYQCICQGSAFPFILLCSFTFELALVSLCGQRSSVIHMHVDPSCLLQRCPVFEHVSGLFLPHTPFFVLYVLYQCSWCPFSPLRGDSWLGCQDLPAMGAVSSRSWLPTVEAPGCLGHSTSIWRCYC